MIFKAVAGLSSTEYEQDDMHRVWAGWYGSEV